MEKINKMLEVALARYERIQVAQHMMAAHEVFMEYLGFVEKNLDENEWIYFNEKIKGEMKK